jgi:hypothetical protein
MILDYTIYLGQCILECPPIIVSNGRFLTIMLSFLVCIAIICILVDNSNWCFLYRKSDIKFDIKQRFVFVLSEHWILAIWSIIWTKFWFYTISCQSITGQRVMFHWSIYRDNKHTFRYHLFELDRQWRHCRLCLLR